MHVENPAAAMRAVFETIFPPERRAPGWDRKWERLEAWCDEPAEADDDGLPPEMDLELRERGWL